MADSSNDAGGGFARGGSVRVLTVAGIDIRLHVSVVVIFALIVASLAQGLLPDWHPEWSAWMCWTAAVAAAILFFVSLVAHELSHALTARSCGIGTRAITLFLFGGVAEMAREPASPADEFRIAAAGPLASFALAMFFSICASVLAPDVPGAAASEIDVSQLSPAATVALWLSAVNLVLALFNLVPGFPLDGGRLLRAVLWWRSGDIVAATRSAATGGSIFGWGFILLGVWRVFGGDLVNGAWLVLIGWFIHRLAQASATHMIVERGLSGFDVGAIMRTRFDRVPAALSLADFVRDHALRSNQVVWPVEENGRDIGFLTTTALAAEHDHSRWDELRVADVAQRFEPGATLSPETDAQVAFDMLTDRLTPVPVVDDNVVGIIHQADILRWLTLHR